eukprot:scaffold1.g5897.t1
MKMAERSDTYVSEEIFLVWLLLMATMLITYLIQRFRFTSLPPSSCSLILGVLVGGISRLMGLSQPLRFSPAAFFYALLPPIVFAAGFTLKKKDFFKNIGAILTYAILGTFISALVFGLATYVLVLIHLVSPSHLAGAPFIECLLYGSAISSIDPVATLAVLTEVEVPPLLYNLVFGESVLNDAVAIVLALTQFYDQPLTWSSLPAILIRFVVLGAGSLAIGVGVALACAFVLKRFQLADRSRGGDLDGTLYEIALVVMGSYLAYLLGEVAGMSGIVSLFFSGICHAHYTHYNVTPEAQVTLRRFFETAAFLCETFIFAYLGLQVATVQHKFDFGLLVSGVPLAVASRACNIFPCSKLINATRRYKLPRNLQLMLWAVGLRGAVAYGLVINMPRADAPAETGVPAIETAALFIVVVTTLGLGSATGPLLRRFDLEGKDDAALYGMAWAEEGLSEGLAGAGGGPLRVEVQEGSALHDKFKEIDEAILKPLFGGRAGNSSTPDPASYLSLGFGQGSQQLGGVLAPHSRPPSAGYGGPPPDEGSQPGLAQAGGTPPRTGSGGPRSDAVQIQMEQPRPGLLAAVLPVQRQEGQEGQQLQGRGLPTEAVPRQSSGGLPFGDAS